MMTVDEAKLVMEAEPVDADSIMRVTVKGSGFARRAMPLMARVGEQQVTGLVLDADEGGFVGFLAAEPADGDELVIYYADEAPFATGVQYHRDVA